jgi:hypothetical protein
MKRMMDVMVRERECHEKAPGLDVFGRFLYGRNVLAVWLPEKKPNRTTGPLVRSHYDTHDQHVSNPVANPCFD